MTPSELKDKDERNKEYEKLKQTHTQKNREHGTL